ncbi:MAG: radical SAM protein, partial [Candidatus Aenigmatarchaeota archaeon]
MELVQSLLNWINGEKILPPILIELKITGKCNLKCLPCPYRYKKCNHELPTEFWLKVVQEAAETGIKECRITGGEAMCRQDVILPLMRLIKNYGMKGSLVTNGTLFTEEIIKEIIKIGWDCIIISLDGPNAEINDYVRGRGVFERVIKGIKTFNLWKEKFKKDSPQIRLNPLITNRNYNKLVDMIKLAHELKVFDVTFQQLVVHHDSAKKLELNEEQLNQLPLFIKNAIQVAKDLRINTNLEELEKSITHREGSNNRLNSTQISFCFYPWFFIGIREDGRAEPCPTDPLKFTDGVNVKDNHLQDIWYGEYFNSIREQVFSSSLERCKKCCPSNIHVGDKSVRGTIDMRVIGLEMEEIVQEVKIQSNAINELKNELHKLRNETNIQ